MHNTCPTDLRTVLSTSTADLRQVEYDAVAVALFGSRAAGCARPSSDWDIFCIGNGRSQRFDNIDVVWVHPSDILTPRWLATDLASHVTTYARWLKGGMSWQADAIDYAGATRAKQERVARVLLALHKVWHVLGNGHRQKHAIVVRRDLQRLCFLLKSVGVPAAPSLDSDWHAGKHRTEVESILPSLGVDVEFSKMVIASA